MAEIVADAFISLALETIRDLFMEEGKLLVGVKDEAEKLQSELELMVWFLKDAEAKKIDKYRIQTWVLKFREIIYDAEDVIESYVFNVKSRSLHGGLGVKKLLKRTTRIVSRLRKTHQVGSQIQELMAKTSSLKESFEKYGVRAIIECGESSGSSLQIKKVLRRSYSHVVEDDFVGLENDVEMIVERLVDGEDRVISIYGMGGLGKTTIARKVYSHPRMRRRFDAFAWVCISQECQTPDILQRILSKLVESDRTERVNTKTIDELVRELYDAQENRNCIFVLDDIWSIDAWECIKPAIRRDTKILLTTRNKEVALHIGPNGFHHQPRLLDEEECWQLLQKKALFKHGKGRGLQSTEDLEALGKEMAKHCGGLPLAVVVLGGILAAKYSIEEWQNVNKNIKHFLVQENGKKGQHCAALEDILSLSYDDLPFRLKPCFLYMSAFPEDSPINAEYLYHLWMGEGLVSANDRIGEEEMMINVAERYLGELVERCMVQVEAMEFSTVIKFESCRLHDLMRDLCLKKATEENFLQWINHQQGIEQVCSSSLTSKIRRLKMIINQDNAARSCSRLRGTMAKHVRSLQLLVDQDEDDGRVMHLIKAQLREHKRLRVLVLERLMPNDFESILKWTFYAVWDHYHLPKSIGNLSHLRFLNVRDSLFLGVPSALGKLENLEILDMRTLITFKLANRFRKLKNLKYLYLPETRSHVPLPSRNLLRFDKSEKLEILENFDVRYCDAKDLSKLTNLRQLGVIMSKELSFLIKSICHLSKLSHVSMNIEEYDEVLSEEVSILFREVLEEHPILSRNLRVLKIVSRVRISLEILEKFPNLQKLELENCDLGREMVFHSNGFPKLKCLALKHLEDMETWSVEEGGMINLSYLKINRCSKMEMIPDGLRFITSLKEVKISHMPIEFVNRVKGVGGREGLDFHKVSHVPSILIKS